MRFVIQTEQHLDFTPIVDGSDVGYARGVDGFLAWNTQVINDRNPGVIQLTAGVGDTVALNFNGLQANVFPGFGQVEPAVTIDLDADDGTATTSLAWTGTQYEFVDIPFAAYLASQAGSNIDLVLTKVEA